MLKRSTYKEQSVVKWVHQCWVDVMKSFRLDLFLVLSRYQDANGVSDEEGDFNLSRTGSYNRHMISYPSLFVSQTAVTVLRRMGSFGGAKEQNEDNQKSKRRNSQGRFQGPLKKTVRERTHEPLKQKARERILESHHRNSQSKDSENF